VDVIGTAIILGLCSAFGVAGLGLAVGGVFANTSRALAQRLISIFPPFGSAIFPLFIRVLRPLLLTASVLCFAIFLFFALVIRQAYFLDEPLVEAAGHGDLNRVQTLLRRGASPDAYGFDGNTTALVYAATYGHRDVVVFLLCSGANPTLRDSYGQLPVEAAAESGHDDIVRVFQDRSMAFCKN
jgi:hypothetical protein